MLLYLKLDLSPVFFPSAVLIWEHDDPDFHLQIIAQTSKIKVILLEQEI